MTLIPITLLFIGCFALIQIVLTLGVGVRRIQTKISLSDGGDKVLLRRIRAHGNFTETVPIALLAMAVAELSGLSPWALWSGALALLIGRILHAAALIFTFGKLMRIIGMSLTLLSILGFGLWCLLHGLASI